MNKRTETSEAIAFIDWCDRHPVIKGLMVHIPNERKCSPQYGKQLKRMGVRAGFPDFFLPYARVTNDHNISNEIICCGLFIELKRDRKCRWQKSQQLWFDKLLDNSYHYEVCYGADHAIEIVKEYLS